MKNYNLGILDSHIETGKLDNSFCRKLTRKTKKRLLKKSKKSFVSFEFLILKETPKNSKKYFFYQVKLSCRVLKKNKQAIVSMLVRFLC